MLTAFTVVLGTLIIQGLTLKPLLRAVALRDDDPVGRELRTARDRAMQAGLASVGGEGSPGAQVVRQEFAGLLAAEPEGTAAGFPARAAYDEMRRDALKAARHAVLAMRDQDEIGDDAFHLIEEELDRIEMVVER